MTRFSKGDRVRLIDECEDDDIGTVYRVLTGAMVDYATPLYDILWDHEPGEPALGSRHYASDLQLLDS